MTLTLTLGLLATPAYAADSPERVSTNQNLPALSVDSMYMVGDGFAEEIRAYRKSGQYLKDQQFIARKAREHLDRYLVDCEARGNCRPAIVFDIDDTLLSWYEVYKKNGFAPTTAQWDQAEANCTTPVIAPVVRLYNYAKSRGVTPVLITGRSEPARTITQACLAKRGISDYGQLIMRSPAEESMTAAEYKLQQRKALAAQGWDLTLTIGDQFSDSAGDVPLGRFVLPNPLYFIP